MVGTVVATDFESDPLTYTITAGNSDPDGNGKVAFAINSATGAISINDSGDLNFEVTPQFNLKVTATDSGGLSSASVTSVILTNVDESGNDPPVIKDAAFILPKYSANGTLVGTVTATDFENDPLTYTITAGNIDSDSDGNLAFAIDGTTGAITVNDSGDFFGKNSSQFDLEVTVTDSGGLSNTSKVIVNQINISNAPVGLDRLIKALPNTDYIFKISDFSFSDPFDVPSNSLLAVKIATLNLSGNFTYKGNSVLVGQFIPAADIAAGLLKFTAPSIALRGRSRTYSREEDRKKRTTNVIPL